MASRSSPLNSAAFRFALIFAAMFAIAAFLLLGMVRHQLGRYGHEVTAGLLANETAALRTQDRSALVGTIQRRMRESTDGSFQYLLLDPSGRRLAGSIPLAAARLGYGSVVMREEPSGHPERLVTAGTRLADGSLLVVASDGYDVGRLRQHMIDFTVVWAIGITLLALVGGWWAGRLFLSRLAAVNRAVDRIMAGQMDQRLPPIGLAPELNALSANLNLMLSRIGGLMDGLRQVSADVAHDLRTPLTRLRQMLDAAHDTPDRDAADLAIEAATAQADHLLAIFAAMLRLAQIEGGSRRARFAPVDLAALLASLIETYEPVATDAAHRLTAATATPGMVQGDAELLAQLFANLIENAIIHTPTGTEVRVEVTEEDDALIASVADNGPGVPVAEHTNITRRFYQLDPSRGGGGAGLGLSLASAIATLHDAKLTIQAGQPGLTVSVIFHALTPRAPRATRQPLL